MLNPEKIGTSMSLFWREAASRMLQKKPDLINDMAIH